MLPEGAHLTLEPSHQSLLEVLEIARVHFISRQHEFLLLTLLL